MAESFVRYTGDGSASNYSVPFNYIDQDHVKVFVDGEEVGYEFINSGTVELDSVPESGSDVIVQRETPKTPLVDFSGGAIITENELDLLTKQNIYLSEETQDRALIIDEDGTVDSKFSRITNASDPLNSKDLVTKDWAENSATSFIVQAESEANAAASSADDALASENAAAASESAAAASEDAAAVSETEAATSASNAASSESAAATSESNAFDSASAAATSESNAATSETNAANSALEASTSEVNAASSAVDSANSASEAATSESNAATSATEASNSATSAATSESNAASSADAAALSEDAAATSESNAAASESAATTSESNASASESNAATSASDAADSASAAASSEDNAATSESNAAASESAAAASESNASDSAAAAANSESNADTSARLAGDYANEEEDIEVEPGRFSAFHWSKKAENVAGGNVNLSQIERGGANTGEALVYNGNEWSPSELTASDVAVSDADDNYSSADVEAVLSEVASNIDAESSARQSHENDRTNPHSVTASQVGADPEGTAASEVASHEDATDPHPQYLVNGDSASFSSVDIGSNWKAREVDGTLVLSHGTTDVMSLDSSGNLAVIGDVTAYGTV